MKVLLFLLLAGLSVADEGLSLKLEAQRAMILGIRYLVKNQNADASWSDPQTPALTALVLTALSRDPNQALPPQAPQLRRAYDWLLAAQKPDGGIYHEGLATYNTSLAIMALLARDEPSDQDAIIRARNFLIGQQSDWGQKGESDHPYDGGIGYGGTYQHSDLSNTHLALEALYHSRQIALDSEDQRRKTLNWEAALQFVSRCQNLTATNDQAWASDDPENKGGFVYFPGDSKAGESTLSESDTVLRSYGSMSYAGLLSLIYADLSPQDPRVTAVHRWLEEHFTVKENPGVGQQGLYYYYHAVAKALAASGTHKLTPAGKAPIDWRRALLTQLLKTQKPDGSWVNPTSRWWENDPILVTSYAVLALQQVSATY